MAGQQLTQLPVCLPACLCIVCLQVERVAKAGGLYKNFTSGQALGYLDGTLPGGACVR